MYQLLLAHKNTHKDTQKSSKTSNLAYTLLFVQGQISQTYGFLCACLTAVLGSQGIVSIISRVTIFSVQWIGKT